MKRLTVVRVEYGKIAKRLSEICCQAHFNRVFCGIGYSRNVESMIIIVYIVCIGP